MTKSQALIKWAQEVGRYQEAQAQLSEAEVAFDSAKDRADELKARAAASFKEYTEMK